MFRRYLLCLLAILPLSRSSAGVVINEFHSAPNEILTEYDSQGMPRIGYGPAWWEPSWSDAHWQTGTAPLGHSTTGLGKDIGLDMDNLTPSLYVRKTFTVPASEATLPTDLILKVWYDDGFIAYLNGTEVTRANLGPPRQVTYRDQVTYRATGIDPQPAEYNLGPANTWLVTGSNLLAFQVHNRDLGGACMIDAQLSTSAAAVTSSLANFSFNDHTATTILTHERNAAGAANTANGTPEPGTWLASAPAPASDPAWPGLTILSTAAPAGGIGDTGSLTWSFSQSAAGNLPAAVFAPPVTAPAATPGSLTDFDLGRMEIQFRFRTSPGATFGFRVDPQPGTATAALTGFPNITVNNATAEDPPLEFANNSGGSRTQTVNASGSALLSSSGVVRHAPVLEHGPALRNAAYKYTENNTAAAGAGGTTGALKLELTDAPDTAAEADWLQYSRGGYIVRGWQPGAITASDLARVNLTFASKIPTGITWRVFVQADNASATYADRGDFGSITGNGDWQVFDQPFSAAANTGALLTRLNGLASTTLRIYFRAEPTLPVNQPLWLDRIGFSSTWRVYSARLSSASAASRTAFLQTMNATGSTTFQPVITKGSSAIAPAADTLSIDDYQVTWRNSGGIQEWVPASAPDWRYFAGRHEPGALVDAAEFADPLYDGDLRDWLELHNDDTAAADLTGWSLTDYASQPALWRFPAGTSIPAGGYLVIICDGRTTPLAGARYLHTNFELGTDGEHLTLRDPAGAIISDVSGYSKQNAFHTWGRQPSGTVYGYLRHGTPGRANTGPFFPLRAKTPDFNLPGGFYTGSQTISIASETPGTTIRYTLDGSEPRLTSPVYTAPLTLGPLGVNRGHCLRAKAWLNTGIESDIKTATYLINQSPLLTTAPALILTGDPERSLYTPYGISAIVGGTRDTQGVWVPTSSSDYNNVLGDLNNAITGGQAWERPFNIELRYADGRAGFNEAAGVRISGSGHARPRYVLSGFQNAPWSYTNYIEKPSFNIFFRNEYDKPGVEQQLFPRGYPVEYFEQLRVRAGKNDTSNPFVKDEFMRRLFIEAGQQGSRGIFNTLYVNGSFRGVYNTTERLREPFMQQHFNSTQSWDVRQVTEIANGDATAFNSFVTLLEAYNSDPASQAKYDAAAAQLDIPAFIDYALVNIWGGTGDWPHNNYVASRERTPAGKWRWFVWDAEGAFGGFSKHLGYNVITQDLLTSVTTAGREICRTYSRMSRNAEFRLQFADRIHQHFCNGGAFTDARLTALRNAVISEYQPLFSYMFPTGTLNTSWFSSWVHNTNLDKRDVLFRSAILDDPTTTVTGDTKEFGYQFPLAGLWPATDGQGTWAAPHPPAFSTHGGDVPAGFALTISHTEPDTDRTRDTPYRTTASQSPAGRTIYYTTNGSDPRVTGGAISPSALIWTAPVPLTGLTATIKSRIRDTVTNEWSPLTQASFRIGAEPPSSQNLVIAEVLYHPQNALPGEAPWTDGDDFEFLRVLNTGTQPVYLGGTRLVQGVGFDFSTGAIQILPPGSSALVVANTAAFRARYGSGYDSIIAGEYTGTSLSNGGERIRLETSAAVTIQDFIYDDAAPWPVAADGYGPSLVLVAPNSQPDHTLPGNWTASARPGGLLDGSSLPALSYARWRSLYWDPLAAADDTLTSPSADADGDGFTNYVEYAMGSDPHRAASDSFTGYTTMLGGEPVICMEYQLLTSPAGLTAQPQYSTQLSTWEPALPLAPPVVRPDGTTTHRYYAPAAAGQRVFLRVQFSGE